ncbi:SixA phosphatase family protein [Rufibacter radiotolerans]|uniref:SixA phosphatase family protein n=1 Tax=Rufibacter radiotolerans TaxID=1379910 RepID=UPI00069D973D|nr:histidine phosphatase family protein [Rufibacter radiotolerans]
MKQKLTFLLFLSWCCLTATFLLGCTQNNTATGTTGTNATAKKETVVYLVRHAEKDTSDPKNEDPNLTPAGQQRAEALKTLLAQEPVAALYATKYVRTRQTLQPIAQSKSLPIATYEAHNFKGLAQTIKEKHPGQTVVVAGHSNTLLPLVEALGGKKPFAEITDAQYDYLFKLTLESGQETRVEVLQVGEANVAPVK